MSAVPVPPPSSRSTNLPNIVDRSDAISNVDAVSNVANLKRLVTMLQKEQSKIQDLLGSLSFSLRSFNNLNQFLSLIPLIASRVTEADAAALVLFKPNAQATLELLYFHEGAPCPNLRYVLELSTRRLVSQKVPEPAMVSYVEKQLQGGLGEEYRWYSTPILVRNIAPHERGRLYLFSRDEGYSWSETRQKLSQLVADQTSVAIENDDLTAKLRRQERLAKELEIGAEIQARLLPESCPKVEGVELAAHCKTASHVGGDYFDFIPIYFKPPTQQQVKLEQADRWSIVIGDVMGKGVPAGLMMTMTRGMLRTDILNHHSPARILQDLNYVMYGDLESSHRFVTLFYSEYDPKTRTLVFSNAAHHPPLLWRAHSNKIERLDTDGLLIGLDVNTTFSEAEIRIRPGDTIIYYTDGFTDAASPDGDRFEEDNLIESFKWACNEGYSAQEILDFLYERVETFVGESNQRTDDMTLIVLKANASSLRLPSFDSRL
ncbi:MAG: GAF domain-containing SpoIIE family protein phosphatase [Cyanobacteria bacterium P01_F01_bin.42]